MSARTSAVLPCPGVPIPSKYDGLPTLTRAQIAKRIAGGELLVVHAPLVYKIPFQWLSAHPGGDLAILHYVGRDASNEIEAYHSGKTVSTVMSRWITGKLQDGQDWRDMVPPIQLGQRNTGVPHIQVTAPDAPVAKPIQVDPALPPLEELPLTPSYQQHLRKAHRELHQRLRQLELDTPPPFLSGYGPSLVIYVSLFASFVYLYATATTTWGYLASAVALGAWWHQITFVAHDAAHTGLTGDWWRDRVAGILIGDFLGGLSIGWWADNHNIHHLVTNSPEHDPDIQHLPFFAISTKFFSSLTSSYYGHVMKLDAFAKRMLPYQHKLYYVIMTFARFNLFALSYSFVLTKWPRRGTPLWKLRMLEFAGLAFFWTWFSAVVRGIPGIGTRVMFVLVAFAVTSPLHVQIVLSHFSQSVSVTNEPCTVAASKTTPPAVELIESHVHRQLRTTMDIDCAPWLDFLHGGLNFQTPHHLFPRIPRFRFRRVARELEKWVDEQNELIKDGCFEGEKLKPNEGIVYKKMKFVEANRSVLGVLKSVADQVELLARVAEADAKGQLRH